jgi:hypothetical protein
MGDRQARSPGWSAGRERVRWPGSGRSRAGTPESLQGCSSAAALRLGYGAFSIRLRATDGGPGMRSWWAKAARTAFRYSSVSRPSVLRYEEGVSSSIATRSRVQNTGPYVSTRSRSSRFGSAFRMWSASVLSFSWTCARSASWLGSTWHPRRYWNPRRSGPPPGGIGRLWRGGPPAWQISVGFPALGAVGGLPAWFGSRAGPASARRTGAAQERLPWLLHAAGLAGTVAYP